jgi:hypothetical protein
MDQLTFASAREVLTVMGLQPEGSLATICRQWQVCCDDEIVFDLGATSG